MDGPTVVTTVMRKILLVALAGALAVPVFAGPEKAKPKPKKAAPSVSGPAAIVNMLRTRRVSVKMEKATLDQFVNYLRAASGINIVVNKARIEKDGGDVEGIEIDLDLENVTLANAIKVALGGLDLGFKIKGNVLLITSKKDARGKPVLRIYSVAHLLVPIRDFPAPDMNIYPSNYEPPEPPEPEVRQTYESSEELAELIRSFTGQETWEDEGVRITVFRRHLFIRTYPAVHAEIARLLAQLPH
jgi:hypothetical protein